MKKLFIFVIFFMVLSINEQSFYSQINQKLYLSLVIPRGVDVNNISSSFFKYFYAIGAPNEDQYIEVSGNTMFTDIEAVFKIQTETYTKADLSVIPSGTLHFWRVMENGQMISNSYAVFFTP